MNKNLKKILSLILVLLLFSGSVSVAGTDADFSMSVNSKAYGFADEEDETLSSGAYLYRIKENSDGEKSASIVKYTGSATDVGVVSVIDNLPVTEILDGAFRDSKAKWVRIFGNDVVIYPEIIVSYFSRYYAAFSFYSICKCKDDVKNRGCRFLP